MSGETESQVSGWTTDTLKYHFEQQFRDMRAMLDERYATQTKAVDAAFAAAERAVQSALLSAEKAVTKAETASEKRLESVNEFRGQLADQATTFVRRDEVDLRITALTERLNETNGRLSTIEGNTTGAAASRLTMQGLVGTLLAFAAVATAVVIAVAK